MGSKGILIIDDSPTMRRMVEASLRSLPETVFYQAGSGLEAIERLALSPVDLILLDLNMPDMHGMEVLDFISQHQMYRRIPVIVLTTRGDENSRHQALAAGASLYMTKPFAPNELLGRARELLQMVGGGASV